MQKFGEEHAVLVLAFKTDAEYNTVNRVDIIIELNLLFTCNFTFNTAK